MLEVIGVSLMGFLMNVFGQAPTNVEQLQLLSWDKTAIFDLPTQNDPAVEQFVKQYLKDLTAKGFAAGEQRIWIRSQWAELANFQGNIPASAASLTKIATSLAALDKWGTNHQFETQIYASDNAKIENGVLQGNLIVRGDGDPLFVWEEAIAVGNALNRLGIRQVKGNLLISGNFYLNYKTDAKIVGELLKQGINHRLWSSALIKQYQVMPPGTAKPQVAIAGKVGIADNLPNSAKLLLRHRSLPLTEIVKQMNIYSNNEMAEMLAQSVGGAQAVATVAAKAANVPQNEIQLLNGSGLALENRISPRAATAMLMAIEDKYQSQSLGVRDLFPTSGRDRVGTMMNRTIPLGTTIKTGTLDTVSALAGVIPTRDRGQVWFAIINHGNDVSQFRKQQDLFLQRLSQHWHLTPVTIPVTTSVSPYLGDPSRIVNKKPLVENQRQIYNRAG
jgi:D-alanyl-D-alanine carboxypeptidase/D-alanyl-D-alanine-endopeptidase (penicillin-binding protein 4)